MVMLQFIEISNSILYEQEKAQNQVHEMINAFVSHEMRNPLNSIIAKNIEKHELCNQLRKAISDFYD